MRKIQLVNPLRRGVAAVAIGAMALSGCVSPRAQYISANDPCSTIREPFVRIKEDQIARIQKWAAIGAAAGGVTGAAIGNRAAGRGNRAAGTIIGALVGIVAGGFAGAAIGYYSDLQKRAGSTAALRGAVFADADGDYRRTDRLVNAVTNLNECRLRSIEQVAFDYRSKAISKEEAKRRLAGINSAAAADNDLIVAVVEGLETKGGVYVDALSRSGASDSEAYLASAKAYRPRIRPAEFTISNGRKRGRVRGLRISKKSRPRSRNSVTRTAVVAKDLKTGADSHTTAVRNSIHDTEVALDL